MKTQRSFSFWLLIGVGILLNIIYLIGQTMAFINYDFTVSMGLQEPLSDITAVGVASNKGFGLGDTIVYIPLFIIGIIGLLRRSELGLYTLFGAMAITLYWPVVALSTLYFAKGCWADRRCPNLCSNSISQTRLHNNVYVGGGKVHL